MENGIVVVVAAGNNGRYQPTEGYTTVTSPATTPTSSRRCNEADGTPRAPMT